MARPLLPKATAVWLIDNTALSFEQIADFCDLHILEVKAIADGEVATGMVGEDPTANGELTPEDIKAGEQDPGVRLELRKSEIPGPRARTKGAKYTPVSKRQDKPDAIAWLLKHHPDLSDGQIGKLIGTTKKTITAIRDKTHRNSNTIKPRNPVSLGLCKEVDLEKAAAVAESRKRKKDKKS